MLHREAPWSSGYSGSVLVQEVAAKGDSMLGFAMRRLENLLCQPSGNGYIFSN